MKFSHKSYFFLTFTLIFAVFTSCNGFFNKPDNPKQNKAEAGFTYVRILAESQSAARTVMPQDYNPTAETLKNYKLTTTFKAGDSDVDDDENSCSGLSYEQLSEIQLKLRNDKEYTFTLTATYNNGTWSGDETWTISDNKTTLVFALKPQEPGTLSVNADISLVKDSVTSAKIWISDSPAVDRTQFPVKETPMPFTSGTVEFSDTYPSGKHWILMELTDQYGEITIVGPELAYVFPNETTSWTPKIEVLNKKYKITFSREGFDYDDREKTVTARLVKDAEFPEPWVQNIYETTAELPNDWDSDYIARELFISPAGYDFWYWWDGENEWYAGNPISGGTFSEDITLYPLWGRGSYIYNESTEEEINNFIQREIEDETKTEIKVSFNAGTPQTVWNTALSVLEVAGQSKPVVLNLQNVDADWFESNICPDPENPDASKTFARIAGTEDTANIWLKQVRIPTNTQKIPAYAFYNCTALEQINYDTAYAITEIGEYAFANDRIFKSFYNSSNGGSYPRLSTSTDVVIGKRAFLKSGITSIPTGGTSYKIIIGDEAYKGCESLESIEISLGLYSIGAHAFDSCKNLTKVIYTTNPNSYIPKLETIGEGAFVGTAIHTDPETDYKSLLIPYTVRTIGDGAFEELTNLTDVSFEQSSFRRLTKIGTNAFRGTGITAIEIPNSVTTIGDSAFQECTRLASVTVDSTASKLKTIGESAFEGCVFTTISLPSTITTVGKKALAVTSSLNNGVFDFLGTDWCYHYDEKNLYAYSPEEMKFILNGEATSTDIPSTLVKGAAPAEAIKASNLVDLVKSKTNSEDAYFELAFSGEIDSVFKLDPLKNLTVGEYGVGATIGLDLSRVTINDTTGLETFSTLPNYFFAGYGKADTSGETFAFINADNPTEETDIGKVLKSIKLPKNLTSIAGYALAYCPKLESVTIPESVKNIYDLAFGYDEKLQEVTFDGTPNVEFLGSMTFAYTPSLTGITLPDSLKQLNQQVFMCSGITSITIPDNADFLSDGVFYNCKNLETVVIGESVTKMEGCFVGCTSIKSFTLKGDSQWYVNTKVWENGGYTCTVSLPELDNIQDSMKNQDAAMLGADFYRTTDLKKVVESAVSYVKNLTIEVPFTSWDDLSPLKTITSDSCTIDLSGATDNSTDKTIPKGFFEDKNNITSFSMPSGTTTIGERAFASNAYTGQQKRTFTFNEDITTIKEKAFFCNSLSGSFVIPDTITTLGDWAFAGCEPMAPVINATSKLTAIPDYCFLNCKGNSTDKIIIPAGCTSIGRNAFWAITAGGRSEPITFADSSSSWIQYLETEGNPTTSETITAENMPTSTSLYQTPTDYTATAYRWEKVIGNITSGLQFRLTDFTYAESHYIYTSTWEEETLTYPLTRNFETKSGQWTVDKANNTLTLSPSETITSDDIISILKTVMYTIGPVDEFNPFDDGKNYNYIIKNSLPASFEPESLSLNELKQTTQPKVTESDTTVFKAVTYIINLGTLSNGTPVVLNEDYSQGSCIPYKYGWTVHGNKGESVIYCEGYEGTGFPAKLSDLKASYGALQKTNAAGSIGSASFEAPEEMTTGEKTIIWN